MNLADSARSKPEKRGEEVAKKYILLQKILFCGRLILLVSLAVDYCPVLLCVWKTFIWRHKKGFMKATKKFENLINGTIRKYDIAEKNA